MAKSRQEAPVVIEFRKSRSPYFRGVLRKARKYGRYELTQDDRGELHRILIGNRKTLLGMEDTVRDISGWKHARILCEGRVVPFKEALRVIRCGVRRGSARFGGWPCDRGKYTEPQDPFDYWCMSVAVGAYNQPGSNWWDHGRIDEKGVFKVDKVAIRMILEESIEKRYLTLCPYFDRQRALKAIMGLPHEIDPQTNSYWRYARVLEDGGWVNVGVELPGVWLSDPPTPLEEAMLEAVDQATETREAVRGLLKSARKDWKNGQA